MKKFLIVLLSLGLIAAFGMTASAADVKFSGSYYVVGFYDSNDLLQDTGKAYSRAAFYQRVRLQPVFQIAEGLTFTARIDALERQWGNGSWSGSDVTSSRRQVTVNNPKTQENFEFERGYVTFATKIGQFSVGYQSTGKWGTDFGDSEATRSRILYITAAGPVTFLALYEKPYESDYVSGPQPATTNTPSGKADADDDFFALAGIYGFPGGSTGLLYYNLRYASPRPVSNYKIQLHVLAPYVKAQFGPVYVESEVMYTFGKQKEFDTAGAGTDVDRSGWMAYLKVQSALGPATIGAQVGWNQGDDGSDLTKNKNGYGGGGDWNPALILMNSDFATWKPGGNDTSNNDPKTNFLLYQVFGSYNPMPKLTVGAALTFVQKDKSLKDEVSKKVGTEFDVTATYKLYDNLSYMVGAGYLWAGDYWKGTNSANQIGNDYMLMNKLTLSF